jgi:hypothetical protein
MTYSPDWSATMRINQSKLDQLNAIMDAWLDQRKRDQLNGVEDDDDDEDDDCINPLAAPPNAPFSDSPPEHIHGEGKKDLFK